ncbi:hypothetical protein EUGRSUZ_C00579 [Eucalyptus grandis]|uniref:Uncharacterized protein n=2 Tax=Eucalyptus grandis TaxID=71139 RepID=A0ACC3LAB2_EUCGR|nr:hypothetical protein EUGRSUZ_C00579 [Eucalyptus grandis]
MTMVSPQPSKLALVITLIPLFVLCFSGVPARALNIGVQAADAAISVGKDCSRKCESEFCSVPPFLRYGKYCGLLYSGCPGERPCDGLDACCMKHDACVQAKNSEFRHRYFQLFFNQSIDITSCSPAHLHGHNLMRMMRKHFHW